MKKICLTMLLAVAAVLCFAQPQIQFQETTHDFGKIKEEGGKVTGRFVFTNVGTEDLILTNVRPGCGCTAANYTKDPVAPGQQGFIDATYNPYNRPGGFNKNIRVTTNEPRFTDGSNSAPHMIFIKGEVIKRPPTEFEKAGYTKSNGMARFFDPNVKIEALNTQKVKDTFKVRNFWTKPVKFEMNAPKDYITEVYRSFGTELAPGQEGFIILEFDAAKCGKFGQVKETVTYMTNDSIEARKMLHYSINVKEDFSKMTSKQLKNAPVAELAALEYNFGSVAKNSQTQGVVTLVNKGKTPLKIRALSPSTGFFRASAQMMEVPAGGSTNITITFKANSRPGVQKGTLEVITNDPNNAIQVINLNGQIQ
jgi:hypothetical protein